ncbi:MAG: hypothetical protein A2309_09560, partial [Bacteroidetes bacterium RIFOXYB2_FULL_35_7]
MDSITYIDILINGVLAIIMLGVGLSLTIQDFKNILLHPKSLTIALATQMLGLPLLSFLIAYFSGLSGEVQVGIVLVSLCASGASSNLITHLVKGNVALAISMTSVNNILTLFTVPFFVNLALKFFLGKNSDISLPVLQTVLQIFLVTIVPASIGVIAREKKKIIADTLEKPLKIILPLLLGIVFSIKIFAGEEKGGTGITSSEIFQIIPYLLLLNISGMVLGFFVAKLFKLDFRTQYTLAIEVGLQNTALALLVAGTILNSSQM